MHLIYSFCVTTVLVRHDDKFAAIHRYWLCSHTSKLFSNKYKRSIGLNGHLSIWPSPSTRTTAPGDFQIYKFGRPFVDHLYYTLRLADLCLGVDKKIFITNDAFSLYALYGHSIAQEPLLLSHEIHNFDGPFLCHYYYHILSLP